MFFFVDPRVDNRVAIFAHLKKLLQIVFGVLPLLVVCTMGARLRALNVTRMLIKHVAAPPLPASSSSSSRGMAGALAHHQQTFTNSYIRNSSTESFSWSVGSEPGASTGAPSPNDDGFSKPSPASAGWKKPSSRMI